MRFEIWEDVPEELKVTGLRLVGAGPDKTLSVVDGRGKPVSGGELLRVRDNGVIVRVTRVDPDLGFQLDGEGRVVFT